MRLIPTLLLLAACGKGNDSGAGECPTDVAPELEIGVSQDGFVSVADAGGEIELVYGAQGGYHIELAFRAEGLDVDELVSVVTTGTIGGQEKALTNSWEQFRCNPATNTADAWNVRLIYDAQPADLADQTTVVDATLTDAAGTEFTAQTTLKIIDNGG